MCNKNGMSKSLMNRSMKTHDDNKTRQVTEGENCLWLAMFLMPLL